MNDDEKSPKMGIPKSPQNCTFAAWLVLGFKVEGLEFKV
jgi:hypothetical protein